MGSSLCKTMVRRKRITTSSWVASENDNPFESFFNKKERLCIRESYQRLEDPKDVIGNIFVEIINDLCPEMKKVFGVDRAPKVTMLKMPKLGGHVSRMTDFFEQVVFSFIILISSGLAWVVCAKFKLPPTSSFGLCRTHLTTMIGSTENLTGAWQLVRKTGRLHAKVPFLQEFQSQLQKNYFTVITDALTRRLIPHINGSKKEDDAELEKKRVRFLQTYSTAFVTDLWRRFLNVINNQLTEFFEFERQKCLNSDNQKTLAPHQRAEENAARKKRLTAERQSEVEKENAFQLENPKKEEMFEDPF